MREERVGVSIVRERGEREREEGRERESNGERKKERERGLGINEELPFQFFLSVANTLRWWTIGEVQNQRSNRCSDEQQTKNTKTKWHVSKWWRREERML